ncbi:MAG TPA: hypothetical protein VGO89_06230, partial [Streptomyces sp.]|nr:hypothetical protein [Streptomyces sp.]
MQSPLVTETPRPLVCTRDPDLLDDLLRLAAAGGAEVHVPPDPASARPYWMFAPLVLVGADVAPEYAAARLPGRPGLVLVAHGGGSTRLPRGDPADPPDEGLWAAAAAVGAEHVVLLPAAEAWLVERYATPAAGAAGPGRVVAVIGGRGGAGASVLSAALALAASRA